MPTIVEIAAIPIRVILTAYGFLQFGAQVLWLGKRQMPHLVKGGKDPTTQRKNALFAAHRHVIFYLKTLSTLGLVKFRFEGTPWHEPCLVVANHPSLLDFIVFLKHFPYAVCLYKSQSLDNPVLSSFVQVAGYIEGMDGTSGTGKRIVVSCCERLEEGHHVVIFPEGTRSKDATRMRKFRTTGFHAAIRSGVAVQPVAIYCHPLFLGKGQHWAEFCKGRNQMTIRYLPPVHPQKLPAEKHSSAGLANVTYRNIQEALDEMAADANRQRP